MKTYGGVEEEIPIFWISALVWGESSASSSGHFNPQEKDMYQLHSGLSVPQSRFRRYRKVIIFTLLVPEIATFNHPPASSRYIHFANPYLRLSILRSDKVNNPHADGSNLHQPSSETKRIWACAYFLMIFMAITGEVENISGSWLLYRTSSGRITGVRNSAVLVENFTHYNSVRQTRAPVYKQSLSSYKCRMKDAEHRTGSTLQAWSQMGH
jgi:hypothetical protein